MGKVTPSDVGDHPAAYVVRVRFTAGTAARQVLLATCLGVKQPMLPAIAVEVATAAARLPALRLPDSLIAPRKRPLD
eukprot:Skav219640  [mRNA]  locus=scaffold628:298696:299620:+ [translate_table: standard]